MQSWVSDKKVPLLVATHTCWFTWIERNLAIFEERTPSIHSVIPKILGLLSHGQKVQNILLNHSISFQSNKDIISSWFDGVAQMDGQKCGVDGIIKTTNLLVYKWLLNCGIGTNNIA